MGVGGGEDQSSGEERAEGGAQRRWADKRNVGSDGRGAKRRRAPWSWRGGGDDSRRGERRGLSRAAAEGDKGWGEVWGSEEVWADVLEVL